MMVGPSRDFNGFKDSEYTLYSSNFNMEICHELLKTYTDTHILCHQ